MMFVVALLKRLVYLTFMLLWESTYPDLPAKLSRLEKQSN